MKAKYKSYLLTIRICFFKGVAGVIAGIRSQLLFGLLEQREHFLLLLLQDSLINNVFIVTRLIQ